MRVFYESEVLGFNEKEFNDKTTGDIIKYNEVYLKGQDVEGFIEIQRLTTKVNLGQYVGKEGVAEINIDLTGKNKPKLIDFKTGK